MTNTPEAKTGMTRSVMVVGAATLSSRVTGLMRDVVLAWIIGTSVQADAFFAAFRLPNFLRRIFAEGSLSTAFVPVFTELNVTRGPKEAFRLGSNVLSILVPLLVAVSGAGVLLAPQIVAVMTPGWLGDQEKFSLTVTLARWMFPYILLISVAAMAMGMLNAQGHFAAPAFAPVLLNLAMICSGIIAGLTMDKPVLGIAWGVLLGGIAQIAIQALPLWRRGFRPKICLDLKDPHLKKVGRLLVPSLFGSTVYQVNMLVITILASLLPSGSLSYLFYADRLMEFPLGVFAVSVGTVALPAMSAHAARKDMKNLQATLSFAFRQVSLIMVPATVGLIVLREQLMEVIFQRGQFDPQATRLSAQALLCYSVGLWFVAQLRVIGPFFYALQDTKTPMVAATSSLVINVLLAMVLMDPLSHAGLALALSGSAAFQLAILLARIKSKLGMIPWRDLFKNFEKILVASCVMGAICFFGPGLLGWKDGIPFLLKATGLLALVLSGASIYVAILGLLKVDDLRVFLDSVRKLDRAKRKGVAEEERNSTPTKKGWEI
jgi:putative peptidoglycan lipid II flippase